VSFIPLPNNVRGGGAGGFNTSLAPTPVTNCPGNNYGPGVLPANPVPHTQTVNALRVHFRNCVMRGVLPPDSVYPKLRPDVDAFDEDAPGTGDQSDGRAQGRASKGRGPPDLVEANKQAMGFPTIPGLRSTAPELGFINPMLDYDWGAALQLHRRKRHPHQHSATDQAGHQDARSACGC